MKKIKQLGLSLTVISVIGLGFTACGSSSSNTTTENNIKIGTFVDAPVYGLHYTTTTQDGYTNNKGEFKYKNGEKVEFFLNTLSLGKVKASPLITPYTLAGDTNISNPSNKATNIALLLQNFDSNRSDVNILNVTKFKDLGEYDLSYINLNLTTNEIETEITRLLSTGGFQQYVDDTNLTLKNATTVNNEMMNFVESEENKIYNNLIQLSRVHTIIIAIGDTEDKKITWSTDLEVISLKVIEGGAKKAGIGHYDISEKELMLYAKSDAMTGNISIITLEFTVKDPSTNKSRIIKKLIKILHQG
jgi:hypothetical protein